MRQSTASLEKAIRNARGNLLMMLVLTLVNILMICFNSDLSFPFSAFIPQFIWILCYEVYQTLGSAFIITIGVILSFLSLAVYLPFYFLSKKHPFLLLIPMILFFADTLVLLWIISTAFEASMVIDIVFHIWVLYYLVYGVYAAFKIKKLPPDAFVNPLPMNPMVEESSTEQPAQSPEATDTSYDESESNTQSNT